MYFMIPAALLAGGIGWFVFHVVTVLMHGL